MNKIQYGFNLILYDHILTWIILRESPGNIETYPGPYTEKTLDIMHKGKNNITFCAK